MNNFFNDKFYSKVAKKIDDEMYNFLEKEGYHLERGNVQQILELKEKLAKEDKQVRVGVSHIENKMHKDGSVEIIVSRFFFIDSLSHPINKEDIEKMVRKKYVKLGKNENRDCIFL